MKRLGPPLLTALAVLTACSSEPPTGPISSLPRPLTQSEAALVGVGNRFTFSLFKETLRQEPAGTNVFLSPLSVGMALGMTLNGAAGNTETEMRQALALGGMSREEINAAFKGLIELLRGLDSRATFTIANSIWYRNTFQFLPEFMDVNRTNFDAEVQGLDFASPQASSTINQWVNDKTAGRIPEIVPAPLPRDAVMYLVNAIYFKAGWTTRFDPAHTRQAPFQLVGGGTVQVPMMNNSEVPMLTHYSPLVQLADLPYGGGAFSMTILLPGPGVSVDSLARRLTDAEWSGWIASLDSARFDISMPRFTMRYDMDSAVPVLKALGMPGAFCDAPVLPDFTRMDPSGQVCINKVKHKTFVLVDEAGTEAAAATSVEVGVTSAPPSITVDRPFLFVIRERFSGTILFIGRIMNPAA